MRIISPFLLTSYHCELTQSTEDAPEYCGGILGLFMGVSFVSVIELIYYFTLRLGCNRQSFNETINPIDEIPEIKINVNHQQIITLDNGQAK